MKQSIYIIFLSFIFSLDVTIERAELVALNAYKEKSRIVEQIQIHSLLSYPDNHNPSIYIFNIENGGYILISSVDGLVPVLGYGFNNHFNNMNLPPQLENLLGYYIDKIEYVRRNNIRPDDEVVSKWNHYISNPFNPIRDFRERDYLLSTQWGQGHPWNDMCPDDFQGEGDNVQVGCVAVAMSQIMKYWEHPSIGSGNYSYTHPDYGLIEADFNTEYNWDGMQNYTATTASSLLLYHTGVSIEMDYGAEGSSAQIGIDCDQVYENDWDYNAMMVGSCSWALENWSDFFFECQDIEDYYEWDEFCVIDAQCGFCEESYMAYTDYPYPNGLDALKQFFGYNPDAAFIYKEFSEEEYYSDTEWNSMMQNQIDQGYPIFYGGHSETGGHAWVIDGYSDDVFHCNWGWGGENDGYYLFNSLGNPDDPYEFNNCMILDLYPWAGEGCMDLDASNYDSNAIIPCDDCCAYMEGCTDSEAENYNPDAYLDDGSCTYPILIGDINMDGVLNVIDVVNLVNILLDLFNPNENQLVAADINQDGNLDIVDVVNLLNIILDN